jgi:hypothetical protein
MLRRAGPAPHRRIRFRLNGVDAGLVQLVGHERLRELAQPLLEQAGGHVGGVALHLVIALVELRPARAHTHTLSITGRRGGQAGGRADLAMQ